MSWYHQPIPGKDDDEGEVGEEDRDQEEDDGYTPPQEDYLPPGLQVSNSLELG